MKQYSNIELEKLIDDAVNEMVESATPPPLEESWARFEKKLKKQQQLSNSPSIERKKLLSLRLAATAGFIVLLIGALSISFPVKARAIGEKIVKTVETLLGGTQINIGTGYTRDEPGAPPPPEDLRELPASLERNISLEEARTISPFSLTIPQYIPAGYNLDQVKFQEMVKPAATVTLKYKGPDSHYFTLTEMNVPDAFARGYGYDIEDAVVEDLKIGDNTVKVIKFKNETIRISWMKQSIVYGLEGSIPREEAMKIVESMQ